jgi:hypothetical protein
MLLVLVALAAVVQVVKVCRDQQLLERQTRAVVVEVARQETEVLMMLVLAAPAAQAS